MTVGMRTSTGRFLLRSACSLGMALWLGGFTFYSAFVVPIAQDELGSFGSGLITQRVTNVLNLAGLIALVPWWIAVWLDRARPPALLRRLNWTLLATTTLGLAWLAILHRIMDRTLETAEHAGFRAQHRIYLYVSTIMWIANIGLVVLAATRPAGRD